MQNCYSNCEEAHDFQSSDLDHSGSNPSLNQLSEVSQIPINQTDSRNNKLIRNGVDRQVQQIPSTNLNNQFSDCIERDSIFGIELGKRESTISLLQHELALHRELVNQIESTFNSSKIPSGDSSPEQNVIASESIEDCGSNGGPFKVSLINKINRLVAAAAETETIKNEMWTYRDLYYEAIAIVAQIEKKTTEQLQAARIAEGVQKQIKSELEQKSDALISEIAAVNNEKSELETRLLTSEENARKFMSAYARLASQSLETPHRLADNRRPNQVGKSASIIANLLESSPVFSRKNFKDAILAIAESQNQVLGFLIKATTYSDICEARAGAVEKSGRNASCLRLNSDSFLCNLFLRKSHNRDTGDCICIAMSGLFSPNWYLSQNEDVFRAGINPLYHFLLHGGVEGRSPSPYFSSSLYLKENPDVAAAGLNPLLHFLRDGYSEGRRMKRHTSDRSMI